MNTLQRKAKEEHYTIAETVASLQDAHPKEFQELADKAAAVYLELYHRTEPNPYGDSGDLLQGRAACWPMYRKRYTPEQKQCLRVVSLCALADGLLSESDILPDSLPFVVLARTLLYCGDGAGFTLPLLRQGLIQLIDELESSAGGSGLSAGGGGEPHKQNTPPEADTPGTDWDRPDHKSAVCKWIHKTYNGEGKPIKSKVIRAALVHFGLPRDYERRVRTEYDKRQKK